MKHFSLPGTKKVQLLQVETSKGDRDRFLMNNGKTKKKSSTDHIASGLMLQRWLRVTGSLLLSGELWTNL